MRKLNGEIEALLRSIDEKADSDSLIQNVESTKAKMVDAVKDSYVNTLTSTGDADMVQQFTSYGLDNDTLNYPLWLALYNDSWVFKRAIDKPAQDEIKCGIELIGEIENKDEIYRIIKKNRFDLIQLLQWGALFGGSVAVITYDNMNEDDYGKPLNVEKIKASKFMRLYVTDRWYGCQASTLETVSDMGSLDYAKPKYYTITLANGKSIKFHHDYVIRYEHRVAPKILKNGMLQGWGYAEGAHILNELTRDDQLKADITSLINKSLIEVIKMSGMRGLFMGLDKENEEQLQARLEMVNWGRSFNSLTFLDKDDEYSMNQFSGISGLADLLEQNMWLISAALEMPGVLYGHLNKGFTSDNEALERYADTILGRCESYVRPIYEKLLWHLYTKLGITEKIEFNFKSLLNEKKDKEHMEGMEKFIELSSKLLEDGIISAKQYAIALKNYTTNGIIDFNITDEAINQLEDRIHEEMENINLNDL